MKDVTEIELVLFNFGRRTDARKKWHITQILILGLLRKKWHITQILILGLLTSIGL